MSMLYLGLLEVLLLDVLLDLYTCLVIVQLHRSRHYCHNAWHYWIHGCLIRHLGLPTLRVWGFWAIVSCFRV